MSIEASVSTVSSETQSRRSDPQAQEIGERVAGREHVTSGNRLRKVGFGGADKAPG
jgi:hypothetical protein